MNDLYRKLGQLQGRQQMGNQMLRNLGVWTGGADHRGSDQARLRSEQANVAARGAAGLRYEEQQRDQEQQRAAAEAKVLRDREWQMQDAASSRAWDTERDERNFGQQKAIIDYQNSLKPPAAPSINEQINLAKFNQEQAQKSQEQELLRYQREGMGTDETLEARVSDNPSDDWVKRMEREAEASAGPTPDAHAKAVQNALEEQERELARAQAWIGPRTQDQEQRETTLAAEVAAVPSKARQAELARKDTAERADKRVANMVTAQERAAKAAAQADKDAAKVKAEQSKARISAVVSQGRARMAGAKDTREKARIAEAMSDEIAKEIEALTGSPVVVPSQKSPGGLMGWLSNLDFWSDPDDEAPSVASGKPGMGGPGGGPAAEGGSGAPQTPPSPLLPPEIPPLPEAMLPPAPRQPQAATVPQPTPVAGASTPLDIPQMERIAALQEDAKRHQSQQQGADPVSAFLGAMTQQGVPFASMEGGPTRVGAPSKPQEASVESEGQRVTATDLAVNKLKAKSPQEREAALREVAADPEKFKAMGVDPVAVMQALIGA